MKILSTLTVAAVLSAPSLMAFDFQVESIERVPVNGAGEAFHPVFSVDGESLFVTSEGYDGLGLISLSDGKYRQLSERPGAGYRFALSPDGKSVLLRENDFMTQKLGLYTLNLSTGAEQCIAPVVEHTNTLVFDGVVAAYAEPLKRTVVTHIDPSAPRLKSTSSLPKQTLLTEEDLKLVLYVNGQRTEIDPVMDATGRDMNYCWSSLSPDGTKMLFVAGNDAYTSNLDGSDLVCLGPIHAPVWRGNDTVIGMLDKDDGHFFTFSNIVAADIRSADTIQLTPDSDEIKMYPSVSADGMRIAYHTTMGEIYIINLKNK